MENAHALVIGIAGYRYVRPLPSSVQKDALGIYNFLVNPLQGGYPKENVGLLLDEQATLSTLTRELNNLRERTDAGSTILVYLSGHGGRVEIDGVTHEYLLPVDVEAISRETLAQTALSGEQFTEVLHGFPARKVLVVLDCCHAGGIGEPKDILAPTLKDGFSDDFYDQLAAGRGRAIIAACRSTELSGILPGAANSLFTQHLLAGLTGGVPTEDGLVRIFDLFEYLQPRVTKDMPGQHPVFKAQLEENFPVALRLGGQKLHAPVDRQGYRFDAYISYVDTEPDRSWVWETLAPRLEREGLRVVVTGDVEAPGVERVVNIERGIRQAKRTIIVLSDAYLANNLASFESVLAQSMGLQEGTYRLLPVKLMELDESRLPMRVGMLTAIDFSRPSRAEREFERLVRALQGPLPERSA